MSDKFKYTAGLNNVGSYQVSGKPFVTASTISDGVEQKIEFPEVSNNITVKLDSAPVGGTNYNSIFLSGTINAKTTNPIYTTDGHDYSVSMWLSSSEIVSNNQETYWAIGNVTSRNMLKEKNNNFQFIIQSTGGSVAVATPANSVSLGWQFVVCVAKDLGSSIQATVSIDGASSGGDFHSSTVSSTDPIDNQFSSPTVFTVGHTIGIPDGAAIKVRDVILWDGALNSSQISTLYNSGDYYDASLLTAFPKLVWVKDNFKSSAPENHGTTGGDFVVNDFGGTDGNEVLEISSDAPFADIASSGGLRVHFRSTGSLPNVATNKHYWTLDSQNESITMNVKSKEIYLSADGGDIDYSLHTDLTTIPSSRMYEHTGSGVDE